MTRLTWAQFRAVFPGHKLVQSKFNCSRDILLHLFRVCHFHGVLVNKQVSRNTHIMWTARGHLLENLKTKLSDVFLWIEQPARLLYVAAQVCWAIVPICRGQTRMETQPVCAAWLCDPCSRDCILGGFSRKTAWQGCHHCCHSPLSAAGSAS